MKLTILLVCFLAGCSSPLQQNTKRDRSTIMNTNPDWTVSKDFAGNVYYHYKTLAEKQLEQKLNNLGNFPEAK